MKSETEIRRARQLLIAGESLVPQPAREAYRAFRIAFDYVLDEKTEGTAWLEALLQGTSSVIDNQSRKN